MTRKTANETGTTAMHRVRPDCTAEQTVDPERIMDTGCFRTRTNFFDNAMFLLDWAIEEAAKGRGVASIDEKTERVEKALLPALAYSARRLGAPAA